MHDEIAQHLQNHDVRPTAVRIMTWKTLREFDYAFSLSDLEVALPTVDKSTLFRALCLFVEHDLLHPLDDGSGEKKYCICVEHAHCDHDGHDCECSQDTAHHHHDMCEHVHLTCTRCGRTYCLKEERIPQVTVPEGFLIESVQYVIHGICAKCRRGKGV